MLLHTAYAVVEADRTGDRSGIHDLTATSGGAGRARRGWHYWHDTGKREYLGATWAEAVASAKATIAAVDAANRDAEIASAVASGATVADVAAVHDLTPARTGQIARAAGVETRPGRKPTGAATHHTARGRAVLARLVELSAGDPEPALELLARLLAISSALGVDPGAVLDGIATRES